MLIADRDHSTAVLAVLLEARGLRCIVAGDRDGAIATLESRGAPVLAIVNMALPPSGAVDVMLALRRRALAAESPLVVIADQPAMRMDAYRHQQSLGIAAITTTRITMDQLERMIDALLAETPFRARRETRPQLRWA